MNFDPHILVQEDNLETQDVGPWALDKYKLVGNYCNIFTGGMKNKWSQLVYIDLFAGSGHAKLRTTKQIYRNSALIAMSIPNKFHKYILCEQDEKKAAALDERIKRNFQNINYKILIGDSNNLIDSIKAEIPKHGMKNSVLSFCFADPFSLNLKFATVRELGKLFIDFLILQALQMDGVRNFETYYKLENTKVAEYLGLPNWRDIFKAELDKNNGSFLKFLADKYQQQMVSIKYLDWKKMHQIKTHDSNLPLYYLAYFSKNERGHDFFDKIEKSRQNSLF